MSAGNFLCLEPAEVKVKVDAMWQNPQMRNQYEPNVDAAKAIIENQTATFTELTGDEKDRDVKAVWVQNCGLDVEDCSNICDLNGPEAESDCVTYGLDTCKEVSFSVKQTQGDNTMATIAEKVAVLELSALKALDEFLGNKLLQHASSYRGVNQYIGGVGTVSGTSTSIQSAYWNVGLMSYFALVQKKNMFTNPYLLHGENLFQAAMNADINSGNASGSGDAKRIKMIPMYWDIFAMDNAVGAGKTLMIDRGALALATKSYYKNNSVSSPAILPEDMKAWSVPSRSLNGVVYDVFYKVKCDSTTTTPTWLHTFSYRTKAGVFQNPLGCDKTKTGVLEFTCA